jgi:hypothetical protein
LDRIRTRLLLIAGLPLLIAAAQAKPPILSAFWLLPRERVEALSSRPAECATIPKIAGMRESFEIGRAAFRAPLLIGGQAARAELACESCHSNGRRNAAFQFPGLSGEAGTADVTSSIMSSHLGNGRFDPRPIPDLAEPAKVSRDPASGELEAFIRRLIVEEFDGAEPPPIVLSGLADYVRAIGPCDAPRESVTVTGLLDDSRRASIAAGYAWAKGDAAATRLLISAARSALGRIDERYAGTGLADDRAALRSADLALLAIAQAVDRRAPDVSPRLAAWRADMARWTPALVRDEPRSLFNRTLLEAALSR